MKILIVKEDLDVITNCMHKVRACLQTTRPPIDIQVLSVLDTAGERFTNQCDKVIFLITNKPGRIDNVNKEWISNLPKIEYSQTKIGEKQELPQVEKNTSRTSKHKTRKEHPESRVQTDEKKMGRRE